MGLKVIIAGSRTITKKHIVEDAFEEWFSNKNVFEIVSGCAKGIDTLAIEIAKDNDYDLAKFPAKWHDENGRLDKTAGFKRNMKMAEYADVLLAIWDGESKGTKHMIDSMLLLRKPVVIVFHKVSDHFF